MTKKITYFILLCFLTIVFSCKVDDLTDLDNSQHSEHNARMNRVSFGEMKKYLNENGNGFSPQSLNTVFNKSSENYITDIDSTLITKIVYHDFTTFTIHINTKDDDKYKFSNLIINLKNGELQEYIYHYNPTENWLAQFNSGNKIDYEGDLVVSDIEGNGSQSNRCAMTISIPCYGYECPCRLEMVKLYTLV